MKRKKFIVFLLILLVTLLVGFPLLKLRMLDGDDAVFHFFRNYSAKIALKDGQAIWMLNPYMMGGFGYAVNIFYGVLTPYLTLIIDFFVNNVGLASNLIILISIFLSGLFMYFLTRKLTDNSKLALLSAFFYMCLPYHLYDIYKRVAFGEIMAFIFIPLVFLGIYDILYKNKQHWWLLTIGTAGLFLSHSISVLMVGFFAFLYLIFNYPKLKDKKTLKYLLLALIFALLLSSMTIIPLLEAKLSCDYMVFDNAYMHISGEFMQKHSLNLFNFTNGIDKIGNFYLFLILILIILMIVKKKSNAFCYLTIISFLLATKLIPWKLLPDFLATFQFPWRFLMMTTFFWPLAILLLIKGPNSFKEIKYFSLLLVLCFLVGIPFLVSGVENKGIDNNLINSNRLKKRGLIVRSTGTASAEYIPEKTIYKYKYLKNRPLEPIPLKGSGNLSDIKKDGSKLTFKAKMTRNSTIELPYIYYPGYVVLLNNEETPNFITENGLVGIEVKPGNYEVEAYYRGSDLMALGYYISLVTLLSLIVTIKMEYAEEYIK